MSSLEYLRGEKVWTAKQRPKKDKRLVQLQKKVENNGSNQNQLSEDTVSE
jgi:hypothetical protein